MNIPIISLNSKSYKKEFIESLTNTGFAVLKDHPIEFELIKEAQRNWRMWFLQDQERKDLYLNEEDPNMGYLGNRKETAVGSKVADLKELFHWRPGQAQPHSTWAVTQALFYDLEEVGMQLLEALDEEGPRDDYRDSCFNSDKTLFRSLYYPAMDFKGESGAVRAAAHEDINHITLLVAATSPGLEVKDIHGQWYKVPFEDNSIIVNSGLMLEKASKGRYLATKHRVVNMLGDRVSMPLFVSPDPYTVLEEGLTADQYLRQILQKLYR